MLRRRIAIALASIAALAASRASAQSSSANRPAPPPYSGSAEPIVLDTAHTNNREARIVFRMPRRADGIPAYAVLKIRAGSEDVILDSAEISFVDGRSHKIDLVDRLHAGEESRPIVLDPGTAPVAEVVVMKRPTWRAKESTLALIGIPRMETLAPAHAPTPPPSTARAPGPELINRQSVESREERMVFHVGRELGPLDAIQFSAAEDRLFVERIDVEFANGERQSYDGTGRFEPGVPSPIVQFGRPRHIETVVLWKRAGWRPGRTSVDLLGFPSSREADWRHDEW